MVFARRPALLMMAAVLIIVIIIINRPPRNRKYTQHKMMKFLKKRHTHIQRTMMALLRLWTGVHDHSFRRL